MILIPNLPTFFFCLGVGGSGPAPFCFRPWLGLIKVKWVLVVIWTWIMEQW